MSLQSPFSCAMRPFASVAVRGSSWLVAGGRAPSGGELFASPPQDKDEKARRAEAGRHSIFVQFGVPFNFVYFG